MFFFCMIYNTFSVKSKYLFKIQIVFTIVNFIKTLTTQLFGKENNI